MSRGVASESSPLREVLMCSPRHFEFLPVNATTRRELARGGAADVAAAVDQHEQLVATIESTGASVHRLQPDEGLPYMVYTRDSSLMTPWGPVITQMRKPQRWGEYAHLLRFYERRGESIWNFVTKGSVEGGDVSIAKPGLLLVGCSGERTNAAGAGQLCGWFRSEGWDAHVIEFDDHFCHLDLIFTMVNEHLALCCVEAVPPALHQIAADHEIELIPVTYGEAIALGCNILAVDGQRVVSSEENAGVNRKLDAAGVEVLTTPLGALIPGGGSAHCMTMPLSRG